MNRFLKPPRIVNFLILVSVLWCDFNVKQWNKKDGVIGWDVISYYAYLPATFIYKDVTLKFTVNYKGPHQFVFWPETAPNGGKCIKTSMGLSVLYAPFFFMAHISAVFLHYDAGGYSIPYKFFLVMSGVFYLLLGLFFLRKVLERYFNQWVVAITLAVIVVGTNLFNYSSFDGTMSHAYSFALIAIFIYATQRWYEKYSVTNTFLVGLLIGIISLVRPSNILVILFFVLYNLVSRKAVIERIRLYRQNIPKLLLLMLCVFLVWVPQFIYWKYITGNWLFFSYGDERFFFNRPHIFEGLFGFRKGWLIYSPIMIFAVLGIPLLFKHLKEFSWAISVFFVLNVYVILSWWCWWYGGSFGARAFVDSYALMAIPLALSIQLIWEKRFWIGFALYSTLLITFLKGIHYTIQYHYNAIHYDSMTWGAYKETFWHVRPAGKFWTLLEEPDYEKAKLGFQSIRKQEK